MDPAESINALEVTLRRLIWLVLGEAWVVDVDLDTLRSRQAEERKRRDGSIVDSDLLAYTHVYELRAVINRHWADFKPALHDKKRFEVFMDRVEDFRNAPMHSRTLLPFEIELLSGIVGEIRNEVTIYHSEKGPDMEHYPSVASIVDSFGVAATMSESPESDGLTKTGLRVQVGDVLTFRCSGWDPHGRALTWSLLVPGIHSPEAIDTAVGDEVTLTWSVTPQYVAIHRNIVVQMLSAGQYHRHGRYDFFHVYTYAVDPPRDATPE